MATHDYNIANAAGATVRSDLNDALSAIHSSNSNATTPPAVAGSWWDDTTTDLLKIRNNADAAWYSLFDMATGELAANLGNGLKVNSGDSGATAPSTADEFVVEGNGDMGITLLSPDTNFQTIYFGSPSDTAGAFIQHKYSTNVFNVGTANVGHSMKLRGDNQVTNLTISGASGSELANFVNDVEVDGFLQVGGTAGTYHSLADELAISTASHAGLTLATTNSAATMNLYFAEGASTSIARVIMHGSTNANAGQLHLSTNVSGGQVVLRADTLDTNLTLSGAAGAELAIFEGSVYVKDGWRETPSTSVSSETIATGTFAITGTQYLISVSPESGAADDLVTVTGGSDGQRIRLVGPGLATITIKHDATPGGSGEFSTNTGADITISGVYDHAEFVNYGGVWVQA